MITPRPLTEGDLSAVMELLHAYDRRWFGEPLLTAEDVAAEWSGPEFDLAGDSEGWFDDGTLVAFGTLSTRAGIELAVSGTWAGAGLEEAVLARWEAEARDRGHPAVHRDLPAADVDGLALLEARGWVVGRTGWMLSLDAGAAVDARPLPPGYTVRPMRTADLPDVYEVTSTAFAPFESTLRSYDEWRALRVERADVTPAHCYVATTADEVVGACLVVDPAAAGPDAELWVAQVAVAQPHRRRGLARELLAATVLAGRGRGVPRAALYTHQDTGALGLYERFGMVLRHTLLECRLDL